jgi:geranylgeranyl diphosphate synthase type II
MDAAVRIEQSLAAAVDLAAPTAGCPPGLAAAMRHAVFPGGARVRPRLCLAIAAACGDDQPALSSAAASAIELLHCASLVHDDLPCFDNADTRRGVKSVHRGYGERLAVLAGDALIVLAFDVIARAAVAAPERLVALVGTIAQSVGAPRGIVAGQAWECEDAADLREYQRGKTGSLFVAAVTAGAQAAGGNPVPWIALGERLGEAYQVADDIRDVAATAEALGKPVHQDHTLGRPSAVDALGLVGAVARFDDLVAKAVSSLPRCDAAPMLRHLIRKEAERLIPQEFIQRAA